MRAADLHTNDARDKTGRRCTENCLDVGAAELKRSRKNPHAIQTERASANFETDAKCPSTQRANINKQVEEQGCSTSSHILHDGFPAKSKSFRSCFFEEYNNQNIPPQEKADKSVWSWSSILEGVETEECKSSLDDQGESKAAPVETHVEVGESNCCIGNDDSGLRPATVKAELVGSAAGNADERSHCKQRADIFSISRLAPVAATREVDELTRSVDMHGKEPCSLQVDATLTGSVTLESNEKVSHVCSAGKLCASTSESLVANFNVDESACSYSPQVGTQVPGVQIIRHGSPSPRRMQKRVLPDNEPCPFHLELLSMGLDIDAADESVGSLASLDTTHCSLSSPSMHAEGTVGPATSEMNEASIHVGRATLDPTVLEGVWHYGHGALDHYCLRNDGEGRMRFSEAEVEGRLTKCGDWLQGEISAGGILKGMIRLRGFPSAVSEERFTLVIERSQQEPCGVELEDVNGRFRVKRMVEGSCIHHHNRKHPTFELKVGDFIVAVNDQRDDLHLMIKLMDLVPQVSLLVERPVWRLHVTSQFQASTAIICSPRVTARRRICEVRWMTTHDLICNILESQKDLSVSDLKSHVKEVLGTYFEDITLVHEQEMLNDPAAHPLAEASPDKVIVLCVIRRRELIVGARVEHRGSFGTLLTADDGAYRWWVHMDSGRKILLAPTALRSMSDE